MSQQIKLLILVPLVVIGIGALLFYNQPTEQEMLEGTGGENNQLQTDKLLHDFGTISMKNGNVKAMFKVKNTTQETQMLSKLYTTCMCTQAKLLINGRSEGPFGMPGHGSAPSFQQKLEPNQEAEVEVIYDPNAHGPAGVGVIERSAILESQGGKFTTMNIKANVTP